MGVILATLSLFCSILAHAHHIREGHIFASHETGTGSAVSKYPSSLLRDLLGSPLPSWAFELLPGQTSTYLAAIKGFLYGSKDAVYRPSFGSAVGQTIFTTPEDHRPLTTMVVCA